MNILYIAHRIPYPPNKGDKLRAFRQLAHLAGRHRVWCACFVDDPGDLRYAADLEAICAGVAAVRLRPAIATARGLAGLAAGRTLTESYYRSRAMADILRRWSKTVAFDVVVAFSSSMAPYALDVPAPRRVLDLCDLDSRKWHGYAERSSIPAGWLYRIEGDRLAEREIAWTRAFDATLLITHREARPLLGRVPAGQVHAIGNGVDLPACSGDCRESPSAGGAVPTVGFVGVMNYRPNVDAVRWFVRCCWPRIRSACPEATFRIVGRSPTRSVRRLQAVPGVKVVGGVEDVGSELGRFHVSVAPLRIARGLQNKVLEAMAWAKPVVLTVPAAEGIAALDGDAFVVARDEAEMAEAVVSLLQNQLRRERIGAAGRRFVQSYHRWDTVLRGFELIATGMIEREGSRRPAIGPAMASTSSIDGVRSELWAR